MLRTAEPPAAAITASSAITYRATPRPGYPVEGRAISSGQRSRGNLKTGLPVHFTDAWKPVQDPPKVALSLAREGVVVEPVGEGFCGPPIAERGFRDAPRRPGARGVRSFVQGHEVMAPSLSGTDDVLSS